MSMTKGEEMSEAIDRLMDIVEKYDVKVFIGHNV